jgi:hypothetical protein
MELSFETGRASFNKAIVVTPSCLPKHKAGYEETVKNAESGQRSRIDCPYRSHFENRFCLANDT